jgi:uncharacterized protein (TIGR02118 family)
MFKFVTLYRKVDDEAQLEEFFSATHLPLAEKLPGLRKSEVSRVTGKPGGQSRFHLMYELYFDSADDFYYRVIPSEPGIQLMSALRPWSEARLIDWFFTDSFEEAAPH